MRFIIELSGEDYEGNSFNAEFVLNGSLKGVDMVDEALSNYDFQNIHGDHYEDSFIYCCVTKVEE